MLLTGTTSLRVRSSLMALAAGLLLPLTVHASPRPGPVDDPVAAVLSAHAAVQAGDNDLARRVYLEAATRLPSVSDWLLLRAAQLTPDSTARAALYARVSGRLARHRIPVAEARAREGAGDYLGAARGYEALGWVLDAYRTRLLSDDSSARRSARAGLLVMVEQPSAAAGDAADLFLASFSTYSTGEALALARASARTGRNQAAAPLFHRARQSSGLTDGDRILWGSALAAVGRHTEAIKVWSTIPGRSPRKAEGLYLESRSELRLGRASEAERLWHDIATRYRDNSATASRALFMLADRSAGKADSAAARREWLQLATRYPQSSLAPRARMLAALVSWDQGRSAEAAHAWDELHARYPRSEPGIAAGYWAGRAYEALGDTLHAHARWRTVLHDDSLSYYAVLSARRLGVAPWAPPAAADRFAQMDGLDSALERITLLGRLSMTEEQGLEREAIIGQAGGSAEALLAEADAFRDAGEMSQAIKLTWRALAAGAPADARTYRLLYPLGWQDDLSREASAAGLELPLIAALIRQESMWTASATSSAGALGLMQVMPATGRQLARTLQVTGYSTERLLDPILNLQLGVHYLALQLQRHQGNVYRTLAAYNAGSSRVRRWSSGLPDDPELFVEHIGFNETRDYVRAIERNLALYRSLYGR